ncbi:hypothetical protein V502_02662 [Pseudogymnoascus sp. VKM F-4520 (FW-2644)]|nr:hypothetical protein V502_02662 [Pseudogymnoascus sp. VKM F-4520 (FW-2644)]
MAPSPHSPRVAIINRSSSPTLLSAHNARSAVMNQQIASSHLSAYSTGPVIIGEQTAPGKLSAYNIRSDAMKQESASGKLSAYSAQSATMKQESASGKLSAYKISSVTRNRYSDVLHVGQLSISRDDECLDPDCSNFCQGPKDKSSKTELGCSEDDFSLNMDGVLDAFGPFGRGSLPTIPEYGTPTSNPSQAAAASLRDLGLNTSNPTISDPDLLIYPNLSKRVGRYFENRKPTPDGWTWSVADTPTTGSFTPTTSSFTPTTSSFTPSTSSLTPTTSSFTPTTSSFTPTTSSFTPTTGFYTPTQSTTSVALTDSSTVASGSVTELSQAGPSRPPTPQMALRQMDLLQMALHQVDDSQMGPFQIALHQIDDSQMALRHMDEAQIGNAQMGNRQMGNAQMGDPQIGPLTFESGKHLHPIDVISKMREIQTEGVQPFGPSRFLNHPYGNPTGNPNGNYLGTMSAASNQMTSLPDHLNTCIWVEGAPADLSYFEMLRSIRHCGKVYSVHINPPKEKHFTAAAKIAFCTRVGAERFFQQAHSAIGIIIRGRRICVRWNRNKYRENFNRAESRVLRISGPSTYVNFQVLGEYFAGLFYFNLIWVEELSPGNMIWEFSSILAQAHSAKQAIEREPAMMNMVRIKYERDPCE